MSDDRKIESVYKKEKGRLLNFIRKSVFSSEDAEDILQDVFYRFVENFPEIEMVEGITSWLFTTARNRITDKYRKNKPGLYEDIEILKSDDDETLNLADILRDTGDLPDSEMIKDAVWESVEDALAELPEEQKEVFVLNEFEGYSYKEISARSGVPVNTLLSRKRYAVLYLRTKLQKLYKEMKNEF